jgi:hypothetical protein
VDRVEGPNGFAWKRLPGAIDHLTSDSQDVPMRCSSGQLRTPVRCLRLFTGNLIDSTAAADSQFDRLGPRTINT